MPDRNHKPLDPVLHRYLRTSGGVSMSEQLQPPVLLTLQGLALIGSTSWFRLPMWVFPGS